MALVMPRHSPCQSHYGQVDDDTSSSSSSGGSGGSSLMADQQTVFKDSPLKVLRRKSRSIKGLSPAPHLGSASSPHSTDHSDHSDHSESVVSKSYFWGDSYCNGDHRGRYQGGTKSSNKVKIKCNTRGPSSIYFSEDNCAGLVVMGQHGLASSFRNDTSKASAFLRTVITFLARLFDLFSWWLSTTWSSLTTAPSVLYQFVLTRCFSSQKLLLILMLLLLLVVVVALLVSSACWYFCPYALKETFSRDHIRKELTTIRAQHLDNLQKEMDSWALQCKSEQQRLAQDAVPENMLKKQSLLEAQLTGLRQELASLSQKQAADKQQILLLQQNMEALQSQFRDWTTEFLLRDKEALNELPQNLEHRIFMPVAGELGKSPKEDAAILGLTVNRGVTKEEVHQIIKQALKVYSEDRIGLVDYALESSGGRIITSHCSNSYNTRKAYISVFGIPVWYFYQPPRVILQPQVQPGNCWAFRGPQGFVRVHLSACIHITAVTLEHVPKAMSPTNNIPSAPKDFVIFGLKEDLQAEGVTLGQFTYDRDGEPIQTFYFRDNITATYQVVELRILGNWGHPEYTCIYRFRVHGEPAQ
ncbi:SUN domain-containing protein 2-like [Dromiciops gliroides]|uniref:SUN domain-containing protein 2-like n=1 Tax=Dromiciops gliroides TaxID=33562 RepID=UPI001CC59CD3|nr:SUN domain-containing protein 2-like [Dromiciops gliroides]